jgi:AhpD family alkylhydroperoxidase
LPWRKLPFAERSLASAPLQRQNSELSANHAWLELHRGDVPPALSRSGPCPPKAKTKELIALGIGVAIRCNDCIAFHIKAAVEHGATCEEIGVAIYMGAGPSVMYASHAFAALQQFEDERTKE